MENTRGLPIRRLGRALFAALFLMLGLLAPARVSAQCSPATIFRDGGSATAVAINSNRLFEGVSLGLRISDTTTPGNITELAFLTLDMTPFALELQGTLLYALGPDGLRIIDVANPAAPVVVYSLPGFSGIDLAVGPNRLFLIRNNSVEFYDTTNPAAPVLTHTQPVNAASIDAVAVEYRNSTLYFAQSRVNNCYVESFSVGSMANPVLQGSYLSGASVTRAASRTGLLALYRTSGAVDIVDTTNPAAMTHASLISGLYSDSFHQASLTLGQSSGTPLLYAFNNTTDLVCYSLANPSAPAVQSTVVNYNGVSWVDIAASGSLVAVAQTFGGATHLYDLSTPAVPAFQDTTDPSPYGLQYMALLPGHIVFTSSGLATIYDTSTPASSTFVHSFQPLPALTAATVVTDGSMAFFGQTTSPSLRAWDLSNPAAPVLVGTLTGNNTSIDTLSNNGSMLYFANSTTMKVVDATNPAAMVIRGSTANTMPADASWYDNGYFYIVDEGGGSGGTPAVRVYSVASPDAPVQVAQFTTRPTKILRGAIGADRLIYIWQSDDQIDVFDVTDPASPVLKHSFTFTGDTPGSMMLAESLLCLTMQPSGETVFYDVADPAAPNQLNNTLNPGVSPITYASRNQVLWSGGFSMGLTGSRLPGRPRFSVRPRDAASCPQGQAVFSVTVANDNTVSYRWARNGFDLLDGPNGAYGTVSGAATRTLTITNPSNADTGVYTCTATNGCASTTSSGARLRPIVAPNIILQPSSDTICPGGDAVFSVAWLGTLPATFLWEVESPINPGTWFPIHDGVAGTVTVTGSDTRTLRIHAAAVPPTILTHYRCSITNGCATVTTNGNARLTLDACPCGDADLGRVGGLPGPDGQLDNNDFIVYIDLFFSGDATADFGSTGGIPPGDGAFDNNDFIVFIDAFFAGC